MADSILGISCFYHDAAAALVIDGEVVAAAQEERFSRVKHDPSFPINAIFYCLEEGEILPADLDYIVFYDKLLLTFDRLLSTYLHVAPKGLRSWLMSMSSWLGQKLFIPRLIRKNLRYQGKILYTEHHLAHAASAYYPSPFDDAAIITVDGVGEWATTTYGVGEGSRIRLLGELRFPHSLGLLYSAFTYFCGFKVNSGEYKLMGLAPYGEPKYVDLILKELVDLKEDGSIRLNMNYFGYLSGLKMTNDRFAHLFGGHARIPESPITQREMDIAASIQVVLEKAMLNIAEHVYRMTGKRKLCMAGGVALNCVANSRILRESPFERLWVQPAAGDAGGALGAALAVHYGYLNQPRPVTDGSKDYQHGSYLGPYFSKSEICAFLDTYSYPYRELPEGERAKTVAQFIADGKIVGYFSGRMEFGPRALGARSILGDARRSDTQRIMNLKIKYRESFRPFAPSVLLERVSEYFSFKGESPYMLIVAPVLESRRLPFCCSRNQNGEDISALVNQPRSEIPAVTHLDYSARLQTVGQDEHPDYYAVISAFAEITGCPVIVNTSFNVRGEPIVCTPQDAYRCFMRTEMDALYLDGFWLLKSEQPEWKETKDWRSEFGLD
jgi:carbamoyltransferase